AAVAPAAGTEDLFAGADLETWQGSPELWRFENGELIGLATERVARNEFIYAPEPVGDFHLWSHRRLLGLPISSAESAAPGEV
ncbi:MAG: hypothetical protein OXK79_07995, partial [Chloroflexota bacterium]|nr:hypothetical protein [Chloroflexota bacterium]